MSDPLRVLSFEARKSDEIRSLIERSGGIATVAPAMREVPLGMTDEIRAFTSGLSGLSGGRLDALVFMTGVGAEALLSAIETEQTRDEFFASLEHLQIIVRGPKPFAVLRKWGVRIDARAEEPNTWREVVKSVLEAAPTMNDGARPLENVTIAVQEYGRPSSELYEELKRLGADILAVPVYRWALPEDTQPIENAIAGTIRSDFDLILFTTAQHVDHVLQIADSIGMRDEWLQAASRCVVASIGPTASERIREFGLPVDLEPSHPHMGHLVREAVSAAPELLPVCRARL